jgi:exodeoxyribonuclease-5
MLVLTFAQESAIRAGKEWFSGDRKRKQVWTLSGIAGSGKSTIIEYLTNDLGVDPSRVLYCAYTGAAVQVMRLKGLPAQTIHTAIYTFSKSSKGEYRKHRRDIDELDAIQVIVVDEASMVPQDLLDDILWFKKPTILIGDNNQLPPVEAGENYYIGRPDVRLTEPIRQALDNSIVAMAWEIVQGNITPAAGTYGNNVVVKRSLQLDDMLAVDQVLTRTNALRCRVNKLMRAHKGFRRVLPEPGERLVCRRNNWSKMVQGDLGTMFMVNGLQLLAVSDFNDEDAEYQTVAPRLWPGSGNFTGKVDPDTILEKEDAYKKWFKLSQEEEAKMLFLTYGYAVTGHAMQGSEVDTVLFNSENISKSTKEETMRWLYTCITRAKKHAIWVW